MTLQSFRRQNDGSIIFLAQGPPPHKGPPGYGQDPSNPYRWIPDVPDCGYRFIGSNLNPTCKCMVKVMKCKLLQDSIVSAITCRSCTLYKQEPVSTLTSVMDNLPCDTNQFPHEVWIAGKGPSLDRFDWTVAGWCRIGVNEAAYIVPNCLAASGTDNCILEMYRAKPPNVQFYMVPSTVNYIRFQKVMTWDSEKGYGSGPATVLTCIRKGAKIIHLIGFDALKGINSYAKCLNLKQPGIAKNVFDATRQNLGLIAAKHPHVQLILEDP
jgi:hypothetical protein